MRSISIILVFLVTVPLIASAASESAASEYDSDANIAAGVIASVGTSVTTELSPGKIFGSEENYGQDFYMLIYDRVARESTDRTLKRVLANGTISKEELKQIITGTHLGDLLAQPSPGEALKPGEIAARKAKLKAEITEAKQLSDVEVLSSLEVEQTELFANGDENDSGFDLLVDLDIIDAILFGKSETAFSDSGPGAPAGGSTVGPGTSDSAPSDSPDPSQGGTQNQVQGRSPRTLPQALQEKPPATGSTPSKVARIDEPQKPADKEVACPVNESFNAAVLAARAEENVTGAGDKSATSSENAAGGSSQARDKRGPAKGPAGSRGGVATSTSAPGAKTDKDEPPPAEEPKDWSRPEICGEVFCLKVEARYKKASSYTAKDNCIACHFEKINDSFKKTLDRNLAPSKATGNLLEGSKCKRSLINLKWNIVLVPQPIVTPPNDDLITKGDFLKNFDDFIARYRPGRESRCVKNDKGKYECKEEADPVEEITARVLENAAEGATQTDIATQIRHAVGGKQEEAVKVVEETLLTNESSNVTTQFSVLLQEMDTFNGYIEGFIKVFLQIVQGDETSESPCQKLSQLETCS